MRQTRDGGRRGHVAFEQRGRHGQHACRRCRTRGIRLVRNERSSVDLEREQIADRVRVFGAVQPVNGHASGIRLRLGRSHRAPISSSGNHVRYAAASGRGAPAGGISRVRSLLATFSHVSAASPSASTSIVSSMQAGRLEPGVMAGDAVPVEEGAGRERAGRANTWNGRLRNLSLHDGSHRRQSETERRKRSSQVDPSLNEKRGKSTDYRAGNGTASLSSSERAALRMFFIA